MAEAENKSILRENVGYLDREEQGILQLVIVAIAILK